MRLIDADALKYYGNHIGDEYEDYFHETQWVYRSQIDNAPTIEPKRGEWIGDEEQGTSTCSNCGIVWQFTDGTNGSNFCPNCGADMREREGE